MKICNCKKDFRKDGVQDESLRNTICDLICHLKGKPQWIMALASFIITLCVVFIPNLTKCQFGQLSSSYLSVFSSTLGLSVAAYAVIIGFQSDTLKKLLKEDSNKIKPFHVLCASMIFNGLCQSVTILLAFVYQISNVPFLFFISTFVGCYSLIQILDILLQLLGLRTFVATNNESSEISADSKQH